MISVKNSDVDSNAKSNIFPGSISAARFKPNFGACLPPNQSCIFVRLGQGCSLYRVLDATAIIYAANVRLIVQLLSLRHLQVLPDI